MSDFAHETLIVEDLLELSRNSGILDACLFSHQNPTVATFPRHSNQINFNFRKIENYSAIEAI